MKFLLILLSLACASSVLAAEARPPNIVFILADDLGWTDTTTYGSKYYETPHIDRLAEQGLKFNRYYNSPNCQPTRAAILSGQYAARTGVYTVGSVDRFKWESRPLRPAENVRALPLDKITIAQSLQKAGYATGMFGKWHLGSDSEHHPSKRGFDEAVVSMHKHFNFRTIPEVPRPEGQYLADFLTDRSIEFINRHKDRPFFLYLPHFGVHSPYQAKPDLIAKFKGKRPAGGHNSPVYAAMIASVDESVGRVMALLDELDLADNTVVIFSSDNGGAGGYIREGVKRSEITDNAPLRSGKGSLYEGGVRVPFIVRWPGKVASGTTSDVPAIHVDLYPTFLEIAGTTAPADYVLDGESLMPLFRAAKSTLKRDAIYHHFPGYLGAGGGTWRTTPVGVIHSGDWKLMEFFEDNRHELYNLKEDVGEKVNLAKELPDKAKELHAKMVAWRREIEAPMPTLKNADTSPARR